MQKTIWDIFQSLHFHFVVQMDLMDLMASLYFSILILHVVEQTKAFKYPHFFWSLENISCWLQSGIGFFRTTFWFCIPSLCAQKRKICDKVTFSGLGWWSMTTLAGLSTTLGFKRCSKKSAPWQSLMMMIKTSKENRINGFDILIETGKSLPYIYL